MAINSKSYWTVRKAVYIGHLMITIPCAIIFSTPILITINEYTKGEAPWWVFAFAIITGITLSWLYWGFMVTYWRILAYTKVKNVPELKKKAIRGFLIWPDKHWLFHAEFRTNIQRKKLRNIDKQLFAQHKSNVNLKGKETFSEDDIHIFYETKINFLEVLFSILILSSGFGLLYFGEIYLAFIFILFGVIGIIYELRQIKDRSAQIEINSAGIDTNSSGFVPWNQIISTDIIDLKRGKRINKYLVFRHREATNNSIIHEDRIELTELDINPEIVSRVIKKHLFKDVETN